MDQIFAKTRLFLHTAQLKFSSILPSATIAAAPITAHQNTSSCFIKRLHNQKGPDWGHKTSHFCLHQIWAHLSKTKISALKARAMICTHHPARMHYIQCKTQPNMKQVQAWITSIYLHPNINSYMLRQNWKGLNFPRKMESMLKCSALKWVVFLSHLLWVLDALHSSQNNQQFSNEILSGKMHNGLI